jgi:hypothetical protein
LKITIGLIGDTDGHMAFFIYHPAILMYQRPPVLEDIVVPLATPASSR